MQKDKQDQQKKNSAARNREITGMEMLGWVAASLVGLAIFLSAVCLVAPYIAKSGAQYAEAIRGYKAAMKREAQEALESSKQPPRPTGQSEGDDQSTSDQVKF